MAPPIPKKGKIMNKKKRMPVTSLIPQETVESKIFFLRSEKIMLDSDLAMLYNVETKQLKRAVNRNLERFPDDCVPRTYNERRFGLLSMVLCER